MVTLCCRWDPLEGAVFDSVAVSFEGDDFGVVDEPVDHGRSDNGGTEHFAQRLNGLLEVTMTEARS